MGNRYARFSTGTSLSILGIKNQRTRISQTLNRTKVIGIFIFLFFLVVILFGKQYIKNPSSMSAPVVLKSTRSAVHTPTKTQAMYPAQILNLTNWKITLPLGEAKHATEIKQPELKTFTINPWFFPNGNGVRFRAPVNGVTTEGSDYPRSELREMINNGKDKASWSSTSGTHTLIVNEAITSVPQKKRHIVSAQIHDGSNDVVVIRLDYPLLYVHVKGKNVYTLDKNYALGKRFTVKFVVNNGQTKVYYNGSTSPAYILTKDYSNAYFKAGAYTQSNCIKEKSPQLCKENNYGEVIIYNITVSHS